MSQSCLKYLMKQNYQTNLIVQKYLLYLLNRKFQLFLS